MMARGDDRKVHDERRGGDGEGEEVTTNHTLANMEYISPVRDVMDLKKNRMWMKWKRIMRRRNKLGSLHWESHRSTNFN